MKNSIFICLETSFQHHMKKKIFNFKEKRIALKVRMITRAILMSYLVDKLEKLVYTPKHKLLPQPARFVELEVKINYLDSNNKKIK